MIKKTGILLNPSILLRASKVRMHTNGQQKMGISITPACLSKYNKYRIIKYFKTKPLQASHPCLSYSLFLSRRLAELPTLINHLHTEKKTTLFFIFSLVMNITDSSISVVSTISLVTSVLVNSLSHDLLLLVSISIV